jgi:hypothetical protein
MYLMKLARLLAIGVLTTLPFAAQADVVDFRSVIAASPSASVLMGDQLAQSRARTYPFHITLDVPNTSGEVTLSAIFPEGEGTNLAEFIYHVDGQRLLEYGTMSYATIGDGAAEERLQFLYDVIEGQVYPTLGAPDDANVLGGRVISVGPYTAVEFIALFSTDDLDLTAARIVGVLAPVGPHAVIFVQQTGATRLGIGDVNELPETFLGRILSSLTILAARDETGTMVQF